MRRLQIDFATPGLGRTLHRTPWGWWLAGAAGVLLCGSALLAMARQADHQRQVDARQRQVERVAAAPAPAKRSDIAPARANAVNAAVLQLNLPWRDLHEAVEAASSKDIALLALDPDAQARQLRIQAEAKNSDAMFAYVEQLKAQPFFVGAVLVRHEVNEQDPNQPLRFQVDAQWSPAGRAR